MAQQLEPGECFSCDVNAGRLQPPGGTIYDDAYWIADHAIPLLVRGHVVLKPKRHVHYFADLQPAEADTFGAAAKALLTAMQRALGPERIYICSFAETVHHLHFHLLPRYSSMPALGAGLVESIFTEQRWLTTEADALEAAADVRRAL
jgi:diadenosine tetraphosphate (Ap4A) HIT family hydrolase